MGDGLLLWTPSCTLSPLPEVWCCGEAGSRQSLLEQGQLCSRALWTPGEVRASQSLSPPLLKDAADSGAYFAGVP